MTRCKLLLLALVLVSAGCTDNVESVAREYRATTNEAIDALMMVTNETQARRMTLRVLKPMAQRYQAIDKKLVIVKSNRDKAEFAKEVLESDGIQIYLTDLQVNRQRFGLEIARLRKLYKQHQDENIDCPSLKDLVSKQDILEPLRQNLTEPGLVREMTQFPQAKVKDYDKMFVKFLERRATFVPQRDIKLVW